MLKTILINIAISMGILAICYLFSFLLIYSIFRCLLDEFDRRQKMREDSSPGKESSASKKSSDYLSDDSREK